MRKIRRCDSRCHNAIGEQCLCWCGGRFHGKGNEGELKQFIDEIKNGVCDLPEGASLVPEKNVTISNNAEAV